MASTIGSLPPDFSSVYRPMQLRVYRNDPPGSQIAWIRVATSSDVSTYGNGLQVGQVFIKHAVIQGDVVMQAGQTLHIYRGGGPYIGVWTCINSWEDGSYTYTIIDAPNRGDFTPSGSPTGALRVYLTNYTVLVKVLIYTDPAGTPQEVVLHGQPSDGVGNTYINVDVVLRDYFDYRIDRFLRPVPGTPVQSAHGVSAIFYRLQVVVVYDSPDVDMSAPFDGTHDIYADSVEEGDIASMRVAVNGVHPYADEVFGWSEANFQRFIPATASVPLVMTLMPRSAVPDAASPGVPQDGVQAQSVPGEWRWFTMLTSRNDGWLPPDCFIGILNLDTQPPTFTVGPTVSLSGPAAAFAVGYGPGNLGAPVNGVQHYCVWLCQAGTHAQMSEIIEVRVDGKCREGARPFAWLNKLGGIDAYTFTGREVYSSKTKRATVRKPYSTGTGFDWRERTYRADPERTRTVSTRPLPAEVRRWLAEDMSESANVIARVGTAIVPCVLLTDEAQGGATTPVSSKPFTVEYRMGVDNLSQQA